MWHDNKTNIDLLDFEHLVAPITQIIHNRTLLPCTIGVYGDWGSGKSSLLKMVEEDLKEDEEVLCISFNGWLFEDYDDAKSALMGTILDEIESKRTITEKGKDIIGRLFKQIDWMRFAGMATKQAISFATMGPAGLALTGLSDFSNILEKTKDLATEKANSFDEKQIAEVISKSMGGGKRLRKGIREFHCDFGKLLEETKIKTLVVFIDDLDRCTPDTIIETLEAIRLFLFAEQTAFVIGADERLVKYAVRRRFPEIPGESVDIGREYLEKLIQFPIRIPQLSRFEIETYINLLFTKLNLQDQKDQFEDIRSKVLDRKKETLYEVAFNYGVAKEITPDFYSDLEESLMLSEQIAPILASGLNGNPRQCKRFLNTLLMRIEMAKTREINLEKRKLAKLMILEYFKPEWFKELANLQSNNEGRPEEIKKLEDFLLQKEHPKDEDNAEEQDEPLDIEKKYNSWLSDSWMKDWLKSKPNLTNIDLRPYFYFSRDSLGVISSVTQRMSPKAQEIIGKLLHKSDAVCNRALEESKEISSIDASAIFQTLSQRVRQEEYLGGEDSALNILFRFSKTRKELISQMISLLEKLPEKALPSSVVVKVQELVKDTEFKSLGYNLIEQWSQSRTNKGLATLAGQRLEGGA